MTTESSFKTSVISPAEEVTTLLPRRQPRLYWAQDQSAPELLLQESLGELSLPALIPIKTCEQERSLGVAGMVVVPVEGGGRGPIINHGETITLSLLLSVLTGALGTAQLSPELLTRLESIAAEMPNTKEQTGYASHNEEITLDHLWTGYPPKITLEPAPGPFLHVVHTQVGVAPTDITYVEIPQQEMIYGHSGVTGQQFTIKAALLEKAAPIVKSVNWAPTGITGPPLSVLSTLSSVYTTTIACMGLRIKGSLTLINATAWPVTGAMYAQVSVDAGPWTTIAVLHWNFKENESGTIAEHFDEILVYDQGNHNYQFRGQLVTNSSDVLQRELTGQLQINTVSEFGSGTVLSNDLLIKWASKEKL